MYLPCKQHRGKTARQHNDEEIRKEKQSKITQHNDSTSLSFDLLPPPVKTRTNQQHSIVRSFYFCTLSLFLLLLSLYNKIKKH